MREHLALLEVTELLEVALEKEHQAVSKLEVWVFLEWETGVVMILTTQVEVGVVQLAMAVMLGETTEATEEQDLLLLFPVQVSLMVPAVAVGELTQQELVVLTITVLR